MIKKYSIHFISIMIFSVILLPSCKKYIELTPHDATYDQVFWSTGDNVDKALSGAYGLLRGAIRQDPAIHFIAGDLPSDEFVLDGGEYWNYQSLSYNGRNLYSYVPYLESSLKDWTRFYAVINQCHLVVEHAPAIPGDKYDGGDEYKNQLTGEGHFLRAFTYFYITRIWGDAVLTKESLKDPLAVQPIARSPEEEVLTYCIEDLKQAAQLMDFNVGSGTSKVRADKGAAWALLAHIYAWKHDYANASKYCDSVINSGQYQLEDASNYENIWAGQSQESIFELNMLYNADNNEATDYFFGVFLHEPLIKDKAAYRAWNINTYLTDYLFPDPQADKRYNKIIGLEATGDPVLIKYANVKYYDPNNSPDAYVLNNNLVLLRLADIYLLQAEAAFKLGSDGTAQQALNVVKERAGLDPSINTGEDLFNEILDERFREMYGEGCIMYDLIRMEKLEYWLPDSFTPTRIAAKGYYWPLDMRKLLPQDPLLTQNEWWKNH